MGRHHGKTQSVAHPSSRTGEGFALDVQNKITPLPDGSSVTSYGIDLARAPVPGRRYAADLATVLYKNEYVKMIFSQEKISLSSTALRTMLVVHIAPEAAKEFLSKLQGISPSLDEIATQSNIKPESLFEIEEEPEQTVAFAANMASAAIIGRESCLDFYHASAFVLANITKSKKAMVEPVVRVDLRTSLLISIRDSLQNMESIFTKEDME